MSGYLRKFYLALNARSFPVSEGRPGSEEAVMASSGLDTAVHWGQGVTVTKRGHRLGIEI